MKSTFFSILILTTTFTYAMIGMDGQQDPSAPPAFLINEGANAPIYPNDQQENNHGADKELTEEDNKPGAHKITKNDVLAYLTEQSSEKEAKRLLSKLAGKGKTKAKKHSRKVKNKTTKASDDNMAAFQAMREEHQQENKKRTIGFAELGETLNSLGTGPVADRITDFFLDRLAKNGDAFREQELVRVQAEAAAASRLAGKEIELEQTRITAEQNALAYVQAQERTAGVNSQKWIDLIKNHPYVLVGIASGVSAGFFAAKHGMKVVFNEVQRLVGIPKLAQETSLLTVREKIAKSLGYYKEEILNTQDVIFNAEFKRRMDRLTVAIKNTVLNDGYFRNLLFYGAPGTGKTLHAKTIAKNSGMDYIYFSGSGLFKFSPKEALNQIDNLFEYAKRSSRKLMVIIDEAEVLFPNRNEHLNLETQKVLNHLLSYLGTESKDYFVVALTNKPENLDKAFISRCTEKISFPAPGLGEVKAMLNLYINKLLRPIPVVKTTFYQKWFGKKTPIKSLWVEPGALNPQAVNTLAQKIHEHGFVGRDISQLIIAIKSEAYATHGLRLTKEMVDEIVKRKIQEKNEADNNYFKSGVVG